MKNLDPWILESIDGLAAAKLILNTSLESKSRLALILLDSTLEISFKNYLIYIKGIKKLDKIILENRESLHKIIKKNSKIEEEDWKKIEYYYVKRCELYHEDAGKTLSDTSISIFFNLVIKILDNLYNFNSQIYIKQPEEIFNKEIKKINIPLNKTSKIIEALIIIVGTSEIKNSLDIQKEMFKRGYKKAKEYIPSKITTFIKSKTYNYLFYTDKGGLIKLTEEGQDMFYKLFDKLKEND